MAVWPSIIPRRPSSLLKSCYIETCSLPSQIPSVAAPGTHSLPFTSWDLTHDGDLCTVREIPTVMRVFQDAPIVNRDPASLAYETRGMRGESRRLRGGASS